MAFKYRGTAIHSFPSGTANKHKKNRRGLKKNTAYYGTWNLCEAREQSCMSVITGDTTGAFAKSQRASLLQQVGYSNKSLLVIEFTKPVTNFWCSSSDLWDWLECNYDMANRLSTTSNQAPIARMNGILVHDWDHDESQQPELVYTTMYKS
ncbi:hypothetical protein NA56DRAFT_702839 [Hyaloscypha hepaticicola]|uniref:Uncharacterized protein n=1 Tax=Hyaloscypha hepaticicola TaxID=2082293 RepID=A0A2J6Q6G6_9HELO|nr:hypothetical protein NA56DRAFT_702839 [Hyaloscypha hepaticicola]